MCQYIAADILLENLMADDVILQAIAEAVLDAPLRREKVLRRLRWIVLLVVLGIVVALTASK
jgi:hypothetical protein